MKFLVYIFCSINLYAGTRFLLNAIGVLQTSKYGNGSNVFFAVTLTTSAILPIYMSLFKDNHGIALLINGAPWILTLILLIGNLIFGDYK